MGWNIDRFIDKEKIMDDWLCSICTDVVQNAVQTPCQHLFCKNCIKRWINEGKRICPVDRQQLTLNDLKPMDRFRRQFLDKFIIKCINHADGCLLMARFEDMSNLIEHESNLCEAANRNKIRQEIQGYKDKVTELENEIAEIKEHIACSEQGKDDQVLKQEEIGNQIEDQTEMWQTIADMATDQVKAGRNLSTKVVLLCKETSRDGMGGGASRFYYGNDDNEPEGKLIQDILIIWYIKS